MRRLWIHMGTPKTGSTAVQRFSRERKKYLVANGVDFLIRRKRGSYNDLAIHLRNNQMEQAEAIGADIRARIAASPAETFVISSEMFNAGNAAVLKKLICADERFDIKILGYFRRQDRYLESNYKQKMKTGKVAPGFENHVAKFGTGAGNYLHIVAAWEKAFPEAEFVFRRFETDRFPKGDVIRDVMGLVGIDIDADNKPPSGERANPTPHIDLLDLMQIVARMPDLDARTVFRNMPIHRMPSFKGRAMSNVQAREILAQFEEQNEALRARFFPEDDALFDTSDLDGPEPEIATPSFTEDQRVIVAELLKAVAENVGRNKS